MQNFMRFHFLLYEKPLHAIPEGINICSFACQASSSFPLLKNKLYQFLLFSNFFLIHDIKTLTQPPYSTNLNTFHGTKINSLHPWSSLYIFPQVHNLFFVKFTQWKWDQGFFLMLGSSLKHCLFLPSFCSITYIHLTASSQKSNNWHFFITINSQM